MKTAIELISKERQRQVEKEGWTQQHDDFYHNGSMALALASASYALDVASRESTWDESWKKIYKEYADKIFPFDREFFKPTPNDTIRQLVKAGALIAAEIDRLQRLEQLNETKI